MKVRLCVKTAVTLLLIATLIMTFIISPVLANNDFVDGSEDHLSTQNTGKDVPSGPTNLGTATFETTDLKYPNSETLTGGNVKPNSTVGDESNLNSTNEWSEFIGHNRCSAQLVIGINNGISDAYNRLMGVIAKHDCEVVNTVSMAGEIIAIVVNVSVAEMSSFVEETRADGLSKYIEPRMKVQAQLVPNDPYWSWQWGPQKIEADWAWNTTIGDPSVLVAVIDTGIDWDHPDLAANYVALGYDWVNNDTDPMDDKGHGTHCAGIIAAVINNSIGVAGLAQVRIMAEKGLDQYGEGYEDGLANAIIHAVDQGADILSNSWGSYGESALVHDAVKYAYDSGVLVVAAAGNEATSNKLFPAAFPGVIAVSATDEYDNPASWTNFGDWIELAAPGVNIYSTVWDDSYDYMSGTSVSTPHVAGVAALILSRFPNMTRDQLRLQLRYTADDLGAPGFDEYYGYGRINARRAVEEAQPDHDLLILDWEVPPCVEPGDVATISTTVFNFGISNESDITVQLLVNGSIVDDATIAFLASGTSVTVNCSWSPTVEGTYNVTCYVLPVPGEIRTENNVVWAYVYVRFFVKAVVLDSFGTDHASDTFWDYLNTNWVTYGDTSILIDYTSLGKENITLADIEATNADVLIISDAWSDTYAYGWEFSDSEIEAIKAYVLSGHGIIATSGTFDTWSAPNNQKLAELFGMNPSIWYNWGFNGDGKMTSGTFELQTPRHNELWRNIPDPYLSGPLGTLNPTPSFDWAIQGVITGWIEALSTDHYAAVITSDRVTHKAVYFTCMLESTGQYNENNRQLFYNAIVWTQLPPYEHELSVSLEAPKFLEPGDSSLLNATVYNIGLSNETSVELFLLINGTIVNNVTIPELVNGTSYAIDYLWTPTIEAVYNITAYAPPVAGENVTINNIATKMVRVRSVIGCVVFEEAHLPAYTIGSNLAGDVTGGYSEFANYLAINGYMVSTIDPGTIIDPSILAPVDVLVIVAPQNSYSASELDAIENWVKSGGNLLLIGDWVYFGLQARAIAARFNINLRGDGICDSDENVGQPVQPYYDGANLLIHPITAGVTRVEMYAGDGVTSAPADEISLIVTDLDGTAYWDSDGSPAIGVSVMSAFDGGTAGSGRLIIMTDSNIWDSAHDVDGDGDVDFYDSDNEILALNSINWFLIRYEHDIAVSLEVPTFLEPGDSSLLNATVQNRGLNNETNVELRLLVNGSIVDSIVIPELPTDSSYTLNYLWTPAIEGIYNVTAYAPPMPDENVTANNVKSVIVLVQVLPDILIVNDDDGGSWISGTSLPEFGSALTAAGYDYWVWNESSMGHPPLDFLTKFQLVIWTCGDYWNWAVDPTDAVALESYLAQGGNILLEGEDIGYDHDADSFMVNVAHAIYQVDDTEAPGLTVADPTHPVTFGLPTSFTWLTGPPYDDGVSPTNGGAEVIQYTGTTWTAVTVFEGASNGSVVYYAFPLYCLAQSHGETLAINSINWLLGVRYEHELAVVLEAPDFLEPGDSSLLNATVYNRGLNNETDAELQLMINGSIVDYVVIPELLTGSSYTLSYLWTPTVEGIYNLTAYSPPVPGENFTANNWYTKFARVCARVTVYLDPPTINGTAIGEEFNVSVMIRDAQDIISWQAGLTFNPDLLECTCFKEGEFLSDQGPTVWVEGTINNTAGVITAHGCCLWGDYKASGDGRLAYLTFKVRAPGVSDLHFRDVLVMDYYFNMVPTNIIDVYTVVVDTIPHTVVTVSNSTGSEATYGSGFYGHSFNRTLKEVSFNVTGPYPGFSNVTIPKTLLWVDALDDWAVLIDDILVSGTFTENTTHTSIYFTYTAGIHKVQIFGTHAPPPSYTLTIYTSPTGVTFTVDGVSNTTPWSGTYSENTSVSLIMPEIHTVGDARYYWNQWSDGNTSRSRTVTMNTNITLTAHYTGPYYQLTVTSSPITGITFSIDGNPKTTPYTEWLLDGSYTLVMPETHNGYVWSHWLEDEDTNRIKTITLPETTWTAVYVPAPPVGGKAAPINIPINKPELPALWVWLTILLPLAATTIFVKLKKKKQ